MSCLFRRNFPWGCEKREKWQTEQNINTGIYEQSVGFVGLEGWAIESHLRLASISKFETANSAHRVAISDRHDSTEVVSTWPKRSPTVVETVRATQTQPNARGIAP
jgi:hypothetical protein